jgi:hypothetical protein
VLIPRRMGIFPCYTGCFNFSSLAFDLVSEACEPCHFYAKLNAASKRPPDNMERTPFMILISCCKLMMGFYCLHKSTFTELCGIFTPAFLSVLDAFRHKWSSLEFSSVYKYLVVFQFYQHNHHQQYSELLNHITTH